METKCRYPNCQRMAGKSWTTCAAHHTAGMRRSHYMKMKRQHDKRAALAGRE